MKKTLLFASLVLSASVASAQFVINSANLPSIGDVQFITADTVPNSGINAGAAGTGQTYDFSDFNLDIEEMVPMVDPSNLLKSENFPNANLGIDQGVSVYLQKDAAEYKFLGIVLPGAFVQSNDDVVIKYDDPQTFLELPAAYQSTFSDNFSGSGSWYIGQEIQGFQVDSARITYTGNSQSVMDGSGTIITPAGTFNNILRQRVVLTETQDIEGCIATGIPGVPCQWQTFQSGTETSVEYTYFGADSHFPLASISYNAAEDTVQEVTINSDPAITSIVEYSPTVIEGGIYPNPAVDVVTFVKPVKSAKLVDAAGRIVELEVTNQTINVSAIAAGNYTIIATNEAGFPEHHPIVISK